MPEGDTIFRAAHMLGKALVDDIVTGFESSLDIIREIDQGTHVVGRRIHSIQAHGKHLLMVLRLESSMANDILLESVPTPSVWGFELQRGDLVLHTHMRMTGSWHIYRPGEAWGKPRSYARVVLSTQSYVAPCFSAPVVELLTAREAVRHPMLTSRGTDAISSEFDPLQAAAQFRKLNDVPIGVALMNQRAMAGVGNVFKSEVMYIRRVNPFDTVQTLDDHQLNALIDECHGLLVLNRTKGRRQTRFALDSNARLWVYGRSGQPCFTCGTFIKMKRQGLGGRSTYYCPKCQAGG